MGYCIDMRSASFCIKKDNIPKALKAMKSMAKDTSKGGGGASFGGKTTISFAWVDTKELVKVKTIEEAFAVWGYPVERGEKGGDVSEIYYEFEKIGDERQMFEVIAPYVERGSYLEMSGEDNETWQWYFNGRELEELSATLDYGGHKEMIDKILEKKEILPLLLGINKRLDNKIAGVLKRKE